MAVARARRRVAAAWPRREPPRWLRASCGGVAGLLLACISSAGILAERVARGDACVVMVADAVAAATAVVVLATTLRPFLMRRGGRARAGRSAGVMAAQALGALLGVLVVHLALRGASLHAWGWLREQPRQLVNDLAAVFGAFALIWGRAEQPVGRVASLAAVVIAVVYALTAPMWHVDAWSAELLGGALRPISVQIAVLAQLACTAVGVGVFHRLHVRSAGGRGAA